MGGLTEKIEAVIKAWAADPKGLAPDITGTLAKALAPAGTDPESLRPSILAGVDRAFRSRLPGNTPVTMADAIAEEMSSWLAGYAC